MNRKLLILIFLGLKISNLLALRAAFAVNVSRGCAPLLVDFTNQSSGSISSLSYNFKDGGNSSSPSPTYTFTKPGLYNVELTVSDGSSSDVYTYTINVLKPPTANFEASVTEICAKEQITFKNLMLKGDTTIRTVTWDFGDGTTVNSKNDIKKSYTTANVYNVILTLRDANGCANTLIKNNYITINALPKADFIFDSRFSCTAPMIVNFTNKSSSNSTTYEWNFGNGNTSSQLNPQNVYTTEQSVNIALKVKTAKGCENTKTANLNVKFGKINADFTASSFSGCVPYNPTLKNNTLPNNVIYDYYWDFGDGSKSRIENPPKTFPKIGTYNVKLRVVGVGVNCADSIVKKIIVSDRPTSNLTVSDTLGCFGALNVAFKAPNSFGKKWTWYIDNKNEFTNSDNLNYIFETKGIKNVFLEIEDSAGCKANFQFPRIIVQDIKAEFFLKDTTGCIPFKTKIKNESKVALPFINKYFWTFENNVSSYLANPAHTYTQLGNYMVKLEIEDKFGCKDSYKENIRVGVAVKPSFTEDKIAICVNERIKFTNTTPPSIYDDKLKWEWVLQGKKGYERDFFQTFVRREPGKLSPMLISFNNGCRDTLVKDSLIDLLGPFANFKSTFDTCYSDVVRLTNQIVDYTYFQWQLPNNVNRNDSEFRMKMPKIGVMPVSLNAYNSKTGCRDTVFNKVTTPATVSRVNFVVLNKCTPLKVLFINNYIDAPMKLKWKFGNGEFSDTLIDRFEYIYKEPGNFKIELDGWDSRGCFYTSTQNIIVKGPKVASKVFPLKGCLPLKIYLQDSFSGTDIKSKKWLIANDEITATNKNEIVEYTINDLPSNGDTLVKVTLQAIDVFGCKSERDFYIRPSGPKAELTFNRLADCAATTNTFEAIINTKATAMPAKLNWQMGDGTTYNTEKVEHIYAKAGMYNLLLLITDANGCEYKNEQNVFAPKPDLMSKFNALNTNVNCPPLLVNFRDTSIYSINPIVQYYWDFGDGTFSYLQHPSKIYTQSGKYTVSLTVTNSLQCKNTYTLKNIINVGGPTATYAILNKIGCQKNTVSFNANAINASKVTWDFGNGYTQLGSSIKYRYNDSGKFFPKLYLVDSFNCVNIIVPKDTIRILPSPKALFSFNSYCLDDEILYKNNSIPQSKDTNLIYTWNFNNSTSNLKHIQTKFTNQGNYNIQLITQNKNCSDTSNIAHIINKPNANFTINNTKLCAGNLLVITNNSSSNFNPLNYTWYANNTQFSTLKNANNIPFAKGDYQLKLMVQDSLNCRDTLKTNTIIHVGDTQSPKPINIQNVTLLSDTEFKILIDTSADNDFLNYTLYNFENNKWKNIGNSAIKNQQNFIFNKQQKPKQSQCFIVTQTNYCKAQSDTIISNKHCSIHTQAIAAINANSVKWNKYIGWQAINYKVLRLNEGNSTIYDTIATVNGNTTEYLDTTATCLVNHSYKIAGIGSSNIQYSLSDTSQAKAIWQNILPAPVLMQASVLNDSFVQVKWQLPPNYVRSQYTNIILSREDLNYNLIFDKNIQFYNDRATKINNNSYHYTLKATDACGDTSINSNIGTSILLVGSLMDGSFDAPKFSWNGYLKWQNGVKHYKIERLTEQGVFETIGYTSDTFFTDTYSPNLCIKQYQYRITAIKENANTANDFEAQSVSNQINIKPKSALYLPNAFTPNKNGLNEVFEPKGQYIYKYNFEIYNRWGERIFYSTDCLKGWDGIYNNLEAPEGIYYYKLDALGNDNKKYQLKGTFTLLR